MSRSAEAPTRPKATERPSSLGAVLKFAVTGAVLAMLADAAIGHAMRWKNDPFWTYWVTDTFLITTVFALGTVAIGVGVARRALVTGVQALVLTTYYWTLSPIGLPSHACWLDLEHTWITGIPVHFGVYYLGYLTALWLWRRRWTRGPLGTPTSQAWTAVAVGVGVVLFVGGLQTVLVGTFPGVTWFVMRSVVAIVFTLGWWACVGRDRKRAGGRRSRGSPLRTRDVLSSWMSWTNQAPSPSPLSWQGHSQPTEMRRAPSDCQRGFRRSVPRAGVRRDVGIRRSR